MVVPQLRTGMGFASLWLLVLGAAAPVAFAQAADPPVAIVSGTPGALRLPNQPPDFVCTVFWVRAASTPLPDALVTSTGLGDTTFTRLSAAPMPDCAMANGDEAGVLRLRDVDQTGQRIRARVPRVAFSDGLGTVDGRLRVYVPSQSPTEIPLRLENPYPNVWSNFLAVVGWVSGILVPAAVAALLGRWIWLWEKRWEKSDADRDRFRTYLDQHWNELDILFTTHYRNMYDTYHADQRKFADQLYEVLRDSGFDSIPWKQRNELREALSNKPAPDIVRLMGQIFPTWRTQIEAPWANQPGHDGVSQT
jgi:hypothetical protein